MKGEREREREEERKMKEKRVCYYFSLRSVHQSHSLEIDLIGLFRDNQQPTANSQQPTANSQQPTANSQQPTANIQQVNPFPNLKNKTLLQFKVAHGPMEQHASKNVNNCLNTNIYSYLETKF